MSPDKPLSGDDKARADARSLGQLVRSIRISRGMSIEGLAKAAGVSAGGISQIERGVGNPAFTTLVKIAYGMQVPVGSFLQTDQEPPGLVVRKEHRKRLVELVDVWEAANRDDLFSVTSLKHYPYVANSDFHKPKHLYSWKTLLRCEKNWDAIARALRANVDVALTLYRNGSWAA